MRESRTAQTSIFDFYAPHEFGLHLRRLSDVLDAQPQIIELLEHDLVADECAEAGRKGLSVESIFRCMLLKQKLGISYERLSFVLSDSPTYRCFARLSPGKVPGKSSLQWNIKRIRAQTLERVFKSLALHWNTEGEIDLSRVRVDSTVVKSNIAAPIDSALLNDGIRVLSRMLAQCHGMTGVRARYKDLRKASRKLSAAIFYAKKSEKDRLYPKLLSMGETVLAQFERERDKVMGECVSNIHVERWLSDISHYSELLKQVIDQTRRRVINKEHVPASDKIFSLFEEHTDIIVKGARAVEYGHKLNIVTDAQGLLTTVMIERGNPSDIERYLPLMHEHQALYDRYPDTVVADGGYATIDNVQSARRLGIKRAVFHKKKGLTLSAMGVKQKTYEVLREFRAGVEGNISELKRAFGMGKALWKSLDGFKSYVWSSALCYNLTRMARIRAG